MLWLFDASQRQTLRLFKIVPFKIYVKPLSLLPADAVRQGSLTYRAVARYSAEAEIVRSCFPASNITVVKSSTKQSPRKFQARKLEITRVVTIVRRSYKQCLVKLENLKIIVFENCYKLVVSQRQTLRDTVV